MKQEQRENLFVFVGFAMIKHFMNIQEFFGLLFLVSGTAFVWTIGEFLM